MGPDITENMFNSSVREPQNWTQAERVVTGLYCLI